MNRNDYVKLQTLIDALPEEPTEEYVMVRRIKPLASMRSDSLCAFSYYGLYMMGYSDAMEAWYDAIDKTDAAISSTDFDGLWEQLFAATTVASGAVRKVEELRATIAALSASFCEEKEALETKVAKYKAACERMKKERDQLVSGKIENSDVVTQLSDRVRALEKENAELRLRRCKLDSMLESASQRIKSLEEERNELQSNSSSAEAKIKELEKLVDKDDGTIFDLRVELDCMTRIRKATEAQANRDRQNRDKTIDVLLDTAVRPLAESDSLFYGRAWILTDERGDIHQCTGYDGIGGVKSSILGTVARGGAIVSIERRNPEL